VSHLIPLVVRLDNQITHVVMNIYNDAIVGHKVKSFTLLIYYSLPPHTKR